MLHIDPKIMGHRFNIDLDQKLVLQKKNAMDKNHYQALKVKVENFLNINIIWESFYPEWLSNLDLVLKQNEKQRTCIDFTNLNKACLKDSFPLPQIDQLIEFTVGHKFLSFIDTYSEYNHIPMYEFEKDHTSFITNYDLTTTKSCPSA